MKSMFKLAFGATALAAVSVMGVGAANAADQLVVIKTAGSSYQPGEGLSSATAITLPDGASITVMSQSGATVTKSGPFEGVISTATSGADTGIVPSLQGLFSGPKKSTASLGVVRSAGATTDDVPSAELVSVDLSGTRCIASDGRVSFYRAQADQTVRFGLAEKNGVWAGSTTWNAGGQVKTLPSSVRLNDGATYVATLEGKVSEVTVHRMPGNLASDVEQLKWMADTGCKSQALAKLAALQ